MEKSPTTSPESKTAEPAPSQWDLTAEPAPSQWDSLGESSTVDHPAPADQFNPTDSTPTETAPTWQRRANYAAADRASALLAEYSAQELVDNPALRFNVNPDKFPILTNQYINLPAGNDAVDKVYLDINETLGYMTAATADTVAYLAGESDEQDQPADAVIFLDKSARPVSWLVDEMWEDFTDRPRPERQHFLLIDRAPWLQKVGVPVDNDGRLMEPYGTAAKLERANFAMFQEALRHHPISKSDLARIRLTLIPGGAKTLHDSLSGEELAIFSKYNPLKSTEGHSSLPELPDWLTERIFALPTGLEGKNVAIIDEVQGSGATINIAKYLVEQAINSPDTNVGTHVFWNAHGQVASDVHLSNGQTLMGSIPAWYKHSDENQELGKGVGDLNFAALSEEFQQQPSFDNLTKLYAANVTGRRIDLDSQEGESTRELQEEFRRLAELYRSGHVLVRPAYDFSPDKYDDIMGRLGVEFMSDPGQRNPRSYVSLAAQTSAHRHR